VRGKEKEKEKEKRERPGFGIINKVEATAPLKPAQKVKPARKLLMFPANLQEIEASTRSQRQILELYYFCFGSTFTVPKVRIFSALNVLRNNSCNIPCRLTNLSILALQVIKL